MTPLQSLNDDLAQHIGEMRIVMDEMGRALKAIVAAEDAALAEWHTLSVHPWTGDEPAMKRLASARSALSSYERVRKLYSETTGDAS